MARSGMNMTIDDGIIVWYDGPEWSEVVEEAFKAEVKTVETYAKNNAVWEDRSGDARRTLEGDVEVSRDSEITMILGHGVEYGYWLEVIQNGRFAIIMHTLELYAPVVIAHTIARLKTARKGRN